MELAITKNKSEMERLEGVIQKNIGAFYEVGRALMEIRDNGYYKDVLGYDTFEAYCKERWDFTRMYAHYLIESSMVVENVNHGLQIPPPVNERQTRPLARLEPQQQREAWQKAVETAPEGKVTAAHVSKVVREMETPKPYILKPHQPIFKHELVGEDFRIAYDNMVIELKNASALKWKTTTHAGAMELMRSLVAITEQMGG